MVSTHLDRIEAALRAYAAQQALRTARVQLFSVRSASISTTPSARMLRCAIVIMAAKSQGDWHESLSWLYGGGDLQGAANTPISL